MLVVTTRPPRPSRANPDAAARPTAGRPSAWPVGQPSRLAAAQLPAADGHPDPDQDHPTPTAKMASPILAFQARTAGRPRRNRPVYGPDRSVQAKATGVPR